MKKHTLILLLLAINCRTVAQVINLNNNKSDNIPAEEIERIQAKSRLFYNRIPELKLKMVQRNSVNSDVHTLFAWPLRVTAEYDGIPNYYMIQNYVDDNPGNGVFVEYNCAQRTYDGHNGTDINIWPFWWSMMYKNYVQAVAGAPGIVTDVVDNNGTEANCSCMGNNNVITVLHSDSSISLYYHIRDNSSFVQPGDIVVLGQPLAYVGSAGCSSNPHLHFEVRTKTNQVIDPWVRPNPATDCNNRNEETWWLNQKSYWEPQVNRIMTHSAQPALQGYNGNTDFCPGGETINGQNNFTGGDNVFIGIAMHDYTAGTSLAYTVYYPNGSVWASGNHTTADDYARRYMLFSHTLPANAVSGTYKIAVTYFGVTYYHYFSVNCTASYAVSGTISDNRGYIASSTIVSDAVLTNTSDVKMQSNGYILFTPGFTAASGSTLKARIKSCNYSE